MKWSVAAALLLLGGCYGLVTERVAPFPPLDVRVAPVVQAPPPPERVQVTATKIDIKDKVQFQTGSAEILQVSYELLDDVAKVLQKHPEILLVQIEGHTDSVGDASYNRKLSQQRADSVVKYLVERGVDAKRLVGKGFGPDRPVGDNTTEDGREQNRRVEFNILSQGGNQ